MTKDEKISKSMLDDIVSGSIVSLSRAISCIDSQNPIGTALHHQAKPHIGNADVIGITGPPGAGKSTLINTFISELLKQDFKIAVIAVDPSSPITGGSFLGDRTRMGRHTDNPNVFIRSLSSRGHLGGLTANVTGVIDLCDFAGYDKIILETVGAGQSETEITQFADINIVVSAPGLGDEVQSLKAGILEIADIFVVNKADNPLSKRTESQLKAMLALRDEDKQDVPVVKTVATEDIGIDELCDCVCGLSITHLSELDKKSRLFKRTKSTVLQIANELVRHRLVAEMQDDQMKIIESASEGRVNVTEAAEKILASLNWSSDYDATC